MTFRHQDPATRGRFEKAGDFFKVEDGVAYGWAIVCTDEGKPYWDLQDDHIPEDEMVKASLEFMKESRVGSDQHTGDHVGDVVFAFPVTKTSSTALGIETKKTGLLIGYQPHDKSQLDLIARGERTGFSIGGYLLDYDVGEVGKAIAAKAAAARAAARVGKGSPDPSDVFVPGDVADPATGKKTAPKKRGKVYRRFKIDEISLVTKPAQEGATVAYVKGATIAKVDGDKVFTTSQDGHQHVVDTDDFDADGVGCTSCAISSDGTWHSHTWMRKDDGAIDIADNAGHGHTTTAKAADLPDPADVVEDADDAAASGPVAGGDVLVVNLSAPAAPADSLTAGSRARSVASKSKDTQETTMTDQEIAALNKRTERAEKMAELSAAQRGFAKSLLGPTELDAFLAKTAADRDAMVKAAIEYTAEDGTVYYKHDDPRMIAMAKSADQARKDLVLEQSLRKSAEFAKAAAEEMGNYPEDAASHAAIMGALDTIKDENVRKAAHAAIKAGNVALAKAARMNGTNGNLGKTAAGVTGVQTRMAKAQSDLKTAVEKYQTDHKLSSYAAAFAEATGNDPAVRKLYDEIAELRRAGVDDDEAE